MIDERRKFVRLGVNVKVNWQKPAPPPPILDQENLTKNISEGGICLTANEKLNTGELLLLDIELPNRRFIRAKGRVAWVHEFDIRAKGKRYDVGIEFLEIQPQDREEIKKFMFDLFPRRET
ncbi:MAG: PilZ domain-containing protein [Candidatus Omnitrophota bacterium]